MAKRLTVVISQGQSASPAKRRLEEELVATLLGERGVEVNVVPHLYDLAPDGTGMLCLSSIPGDMVVLSWLYPRAARWILDRNQIRGQEGKSLLKSPGDEDGEDDELDAEGESGDALANGDGEDKPEKDRVVDNRPTPGRKIYCLDLRSHDQVAPFLEEIRRIAKEASTQVVDLLGWVGGSPKSGQLAQFLTPAPGNVHHTPPPVHAPNNGQAPSSVAGAHGANGANGHSDSPAEPGPTTAHVVSEAPARRWYPVIDFSRCTNCMECLDFCLFGVYGVDKAETILVEQPDNCRKGCPACSRVCPENAIIFPQHKTPAIAGAAEGAAGALKIDLSKLFGAPEGVDAAVAERDAELVAAGRDAVGDSVGMPKRRDQSPSGPKDDLDKLMDQLDDQL